MNSDVAILLELQEFDSELLELQDQINRYPLVWEEIKDGMRVLKEEHDAARAAVDTNEADRKRTEVELAKATDFHQRSKRQEAQVTNTKELGAAHAQSEVAERNLNRLTELSKHLADQREPLVARLSAAEEKLAAAKAGAKVERERIREQVNTKKKRVEFLEAERAKVISRVGREALAKYERINKRWPGSAVTPVRNSSCAGCNFAVLPYKLVILHKDDEILTCDNCGRILSHDETFVHPSEV